jgi:3-phenylpropionate/cinnamic acid dioxygenase small subunit
MSDGNLEDRAAIHDLFTRYCCALDNSEIEAVVDCFTEDAILKSPIIDIRNPRLRRPLRGATRRRHVISPYG